MRRMSCIFFMCLLSLVGLAHTGMNHAPKAATGSPAVLQTKMVLRDLWVEHVFWVRNYVFATKSGDKAQLKVAKAEIIANEKAIAASVAPFYGQAASDQLLNLINGHWEAVEAYNAATFKKSQPGQNAARETLFKNAREIAQFLSGANKHWPEDTLYGALTAHGAHHILQIQAVFDGDYEKEAKDWAEMRQHMLVIADVLADGLAAQFPEKF